MGPTDEASAWLRGEGDLMIAAAGRPVPVAVQLGVLAHASVTRLTSLGRYSRRGSIRRSWGSDMADLAGTLARLAPSAIELSRLQRDFLIPLEISVLSGQLQFESRQQLLDYLRAHLPTALQPAVR